MLQVHGINRARHAHAHAHASAPWEAILEFVGTALQLPKVAAEQPFALLIYQEAAKAAMALRNGSSSGSSGGSNNGSNSGSNSSDDHHGAAPVIALTVREQSSGALVGSVLLLRHGSLPNDFAAFHFPHPCRLAQSSPAAAATGILMCPIVVPQQNEPVDFHKTVVRGLAAKAILATQRFGGSSILAHAVRIPPSSFVAVLY